MNTDQAGRRDPNRTLELLWGSATPPSRGPKPALSLGQIVDTAIDIADTEGLAAVSMRRVAQELGFTTMSLYRYVPSKEDLLELMQDGAAAIMPDLAQAPDHWRDALAWWARQSLAMLARHPWFLDIPIQRPPMGPNQVRWMETILQRLRPTGLMPGEMLGILGLVSTFALSTARLDRSMAQAAHETGVGPDDWDDLYGQLLGKVVDPAEFPALAQMTQVGMFAGPDDPAMPADEAHDELQFGLDVILDGIESLINRRRREQSQRPRE